MGGAGSAVAEHMNQAGLGCELLQLGLPDAFIDHGDQAQLRSLVGLDAPGIAQSIRNRFERLLGSVRDTSDRSNVHKLRN